MTGAPLLAAVAAAADGNAVAMMREAIKVIDTPPVTHQVEFHPLLNQDKLIAGANDAGIALSAYCSVARGAVIKEPLFGEIDEAYGKTAGQVVLRWILKKGVSINVLSRYICQSSLT